MMSPTAAAAPMPDRDVRVRGASRPHVIVIFVLAAASLLLAIATQYWHDLGAPFSPEAAAIAAVCFTALHLFSMRRAIEPFDPCLWIPVLIILFYFGMPFAAMLGDDPWLDLYDAWGLGSPPRLSQAYCLALLSLTAFLLGTQIRRPLRLSPPSPSAHARVTLGPALTMAIGGLLMTALGVLMIGPSTVFGLYNDLTLTRKIYGDPRLLDAGALFAQGGVFGLLAGYHARARASYLVAVAATFILCVFMLLTGDRGGLSAFGLGAGWLYTRQIRRLRLLWVVLVFIGAFLVMPIIKEFRDYRSVESTSTLSVRELAAKTFFEMGSSLAVFCYTLDEIPRYKPYDLGMSVVYAVASAVPNFSLTSGKSFLPDSLTHNPSHWVTATANPIKYERVGGGYAYALGAEWYFNFGTLGVLFGMALLGYLTTAIRNKVGAGYLLTIGSALYLSMLALLVRNALGAPIRMGLWPMVGFLVMYPLWPRRQSPRPLVPTETR
jgi:hypothetical protein